MHFDRVFRLCLIISLAHHAACNVEIQVGLEQRTPDEGVFQFSPANITASFGTVINFIFNGIPGNHSVTQSSFAAPCMPLAGGFDSGNIQILQEVAEPPEFSIQITNDSIPIFFYCSQLLPVPHCGTEMVGSINAPGSTYALFRNVALSLGSDPNNIGQGQGGLGLPELGAIALGRVSPQPNITIFGIPLSTATPSSVTQSPVPLSNGIGHHVSSTPDRNPNSSPANINVYMIVAISLGAILFILAISFGVWYTRRIVSRATEKRIGREMVDAPFVMQRSPSDAERHQITKFNVREKRDMQLSNLRRFPPTNIADRHPPAINIPRMDSSPLVLVHREVDVQLCEGGGSALPSIPDQTDQSDVDVPPTYSTIGITHIV